MVVAAAAAAAAALKLRMPITTLLPVIVTRMLASHYLLTPAKSSQVRDYSRQAGIFSRQHTVPTRVLLVPLLHLQLAVRATILQLLRC
jgi:hypothetical protein